MAGENEDGQTVLVAAQGVEGEVEGAERAGEGEGEGVMYVTREEGQVRCHHRYICHGKGSQEKRNNNCIFS